MMLREDGSPGFEVRTEVELLRRPGRADVLLLRRKRRGADGRARVLRRLWRWIDDVALVEFKSSSAPVRRGDMSWWLALAHMLRGLRQRDGESLAVQAVFVVVRKTPTLASELRACGVSPRSERGGYYRLRGAGIDAKLVVLAEVAAADREPLLGLFSASTLPSLPVARWVHRHFATVLRVMGTKITAADRALMRSFIATLPARERLAGLDPAQRLAGLDPEQLAEAIAALPLAQVRRIAARLESRSRRRGGERARTSRTGRPRGR